MMTEQAKCLGHVPDPDSISAHEVELRAWCCHCGQFLAVSIEDLTWHDTSTGHYYGDEDD